MENTTNITILGGGIMGLMVAHTLADLAPVTIVDPNGFPAQNASYMAGGMLAPYSEIEHMDMQWVKAGLASINIWKDTPLNTGFQKTGSLLIAHPDDRHVLERFKTHLPTNKQTYQNVQPLEGQLSQHHQYGIFLEEEAYLSPEKTMHALCEHLSKHDNVKLSKDTPENNDTLIIDCRGIASNDDELRGVKGEIALLRNPEFTLNRPIRLMHPRYPLYVVPREENIFMIGATTIESTQNRNVSLRSSMELLSALYALHPSFAEAEIIELKAGIRPSYPGNLPRITISDNHIACNGLFRHGYLLSPIMAQCVRDHIQGKTNPFMHLFTKGGTNERDNKRAA